MTIMVSNGKLRTPSGLKVAPTSYKKLEAIANELRPILPVVCSKTEPYKIDARRLLEETLPRAGFQYVISQVSLLDECAAFTIPAKHIVVIREDIYDGLFTEQPFSRSTVVHEFAHIVLNHEVTLHRGASLGNHEFYEDSEWQAKALTAALTMPAEAAALARGASDLSIICGTSEKAASYRLERLIKEGKVSPQNNLL
jgi:hypothetical protein